MSLASEVSSLATRVATEFKTIRTLITGSGTGNISGLATTDKSSIVAAINEVQAAGGGGGSSTLPTHTMASLVTAASGSSLVANQSYRITDLDMVATAKTTSTYFFDGVLELGESDSIPSGFVGHISRSGSPKITDAQARVRSFVRC
jgi:hypothetical protein